MSEISTKPYLVRAIYEWCTDNGYTPYVAVWVDDQTRVPREYVKDGEIVLNVSPSATSGLTMANDYIHFNARFNGVARDIVVPVDNVLAIYARENGQGMAFEVARIASSASPKDKEETPPPGPGLSAVPTSPAPEKEGQDAKTDDNPEPDPPKKGGRPTLTRIK